MNRLIRYLSALLLLTGVWTTTASAQSAGKSNFPVPYGPTNVGTDFYFSFPANWDYNSAFKYCRLYITAGVETQVKVYAGPTLVKTIMTVANDIVTVDLTPIQAQIFIRNDLTPVTPDELFRKKAVHVVSEDPIVVYGMNRIQYTSDGFLCLPNNALGTEYIVASARDITGGYQKLPSQYMVIAPYDNTSVTIINSEDTQSNKAGKTVTVQMSQGDVYSAFSKEGSGGDLTGTYIYSTKPVTVTAGQNCTYLPDWRYSACDHLSELMLPVSSWGTVYHLMPFANRIKGDMIRVFAGANNAKIFINGNLYATLPQKGGPEGIGYLQYLPPERYPIEIKSDKPIMVAQYNNSQNYDQSGVGTDPFFLVLTPVEQFQTDLVFCTPANDYTDSYINLVADSAAYYDIEIAKGGSEDWQKVYLKHATIIKNFMSKVNGKTMVGATFKILPGSYRMRGTGPFGGYLYGFNSYDSYGYPLSAAVGNISKPDTVPVTIERKQDCFGTVLGTLLDMPDDDSIRTNLSTVRLDPKFSTNYLLTVAPFEAGITRGTTYKLVVINKNLDAKAALVVYDQHGNVSRDTVYYAAFNVIMDPSLRDFGSFFAGSSGRQIVTVKNLGSRPITITETVLKDKTRGFRIISPTAGFTLGPAGSATSTMDVEIEFTATVSGSFQDSLGIRDDCGFRYLTLLTAEVGTPTIKVTDRDFGAWPIVAQAKVDQIEIKNSSVPGVGATLTITGVAKDITDKVTFSLPNGLPFTFPLKLAPGENKIINVAFKPNAVQPYQDSITFNHNAPPNPINDSVGVLIGRGIKSSLAATDKNWFNRRVGTGPYDSTVSLTNFGSAPVRILGGTLRAGSQFTIIDPAALNNLDLDPGKSYELAVRYTPTAIGPASDTIFYDTEPVQDAQVRSVLSGVGVFPALETQDYNYGSMLVGSTPDVTRTVEFKLPLAGPNGTYIDRVTITSFDLRGDPDFTMDQPTLPVTLTPQNPSVTFTGHFSAQAAGPRNASVTAITDPADNVNATSNWTGVGTTSGAPSINGIPYDFSTLCRTETREITNDLINVGTTDLVITSITPKGLGTDFSIVNMPTLPYTVKAGERLPITIRFAPTTAGPQNGTLEVLSNASNGALNLAVTGTGIEQTANGRVNLEGTATGNRGELGKIVTARVRLMDQINAAFTLKNYTVTITYDAAQLVPQKDKITAGSGNPAGTTATLNTAQTADGKLVIDVVAPDAVLGNGDLVVVPFNVAFSSSLTDSVKATIMTNDIGCLAFAAAPGAIDIVPICGLSVRLIEMTGTTYTLKQNSPNPFNPTTTIAYSLGLDGHTKILLHDASGKLVQVLMDADQQPGSYEVTLDVTNLPSGIYYYTVESGAWKQTRKMIVKK